MEYVPIYQFTSWKQTKFAELIVFVFSANIFSDNFKLFSELSIQFMNMLPCNDLIVVHSNILMHLLCFPRLLLIPSHSSNSIPLTDTTWVWTCVPIRNIKSPKQLMFISQAATQRIFQARKAFEKGHCLQVIITSQSYGVYDGAWSAEPWKNLIWRQHMVYSLAR